jgi:GDPmannose 4,6-dehydratase
MINKRALITGITGQDAAYLAELLLGKGYIVYGTYRGEIIGDMWRLVELEIKDHSNLKFVRWNFEGLEEAVGLLTAVQPDEVYNLAAQSFVANSFHNPIDVAQVTGVGPLYLMEAIRQVNVRIKFYQASSSEMFGSVDTYPQNETTPFRPRNPYGVAKLYAHWATVNYRDFYGMFACSGILFNHESPLRGEKFVTRKIAVAVAQIATGHDTILELGNLSAMRDWGYAKDYVEGIWMMLQNESADTYVLSSGISTSVRCFVEYAFKAVDIKLDWHGEGENEYAVIQGSDRIVVRVNAEFYRPVETNILVGDSSKIRERLGWERSIDIEALCNLMVQEELRRLF